MAYTLWSRGRLIGETELDFIYREGGCRCGWFQPSALGDRLMPIATGVAPALRTLSILGPDATARADVASAADQEETLQLELRGPSGAVIATESIGIIDTHYLLSLPMRELGDENDLDPDAEALLEEWSAHRDEASFGEEEGEFARYQIQVQLVHHDAVP